MGIFKKNEDPISGRERVLNAEIAALEEQIKKLGSQAQAPSAGPRMRSTTFPHGPTVQAHPEPPKPGPEPIFESVDQKRLKGQAEPASKQHFNELGVRKYDLVALIDRIKKHFHGPPLSNPRLVNYLAAGSVQGLRSMRYEKRVARNRFIAVTAFVVLILLGILAAALKGR